MEEHLKEIKIFTYIPFPRIFLFFKYFPLCLLYDKIVFFLFSCAFTTKCDNNCIYKKRLYNLVKFVSDPLCIIDEIK